MFRKFYIWHFVLTTLILIVLLRLSELFNSLQYLYYFLLCSVSESNFLENHFSLLQLDQFLSPILLLIVISVIIIKRKKWGFLSSNINFSKSIFLLIISIFIFAPIIAPYNPNLQFNLSVSKLLPPLSQKKVIERKVENKLVNMSEHLQLYMQFKNEIARDVVDENYFVADSVISKNDFIAYQKNRQIIISAKTRIESHNIYFIFGTDEYGRDIFSRLIYATRLSIFIGSLAIFITLILGLTLGFLSGYFSKLIDAVLNRITEMMLIVPTIFLVILFLALFGNSLSVVIILLGFVGWMSLFKIVRGEVISTKNKNFIISSRLIGMNKWEILLKDFIPLLMPLITVNLVFQFANVIIAESALSFLGLTGNHLYPTWGAMINQGQFYLKQAWWISLFPSISLILTLLSINGLGKEIEKKLNPSTYS